VAGDSRATAVAKLEIEQFFAISLTDRVVTPVATMAMTGLLFFGEWVEGEPLTGRVQWLWLVAFVMQGGGLTEKLVTHPIGH